MNFDKLNQKTENVLLIIKHYALAPGYYDGTEKVIKNVLTGSKAWHHETRHLWQDEIGLKLLHDALYPVTAAGGLMGYALGQDWFIWVFAFQFAMFATLEIDAWRYSGRMVAVAAPLPGTNREAPPGPNQKRDRKDTPATK